MFDAIRKFLADHALSREPVEFDGADDRLAAAALLVHVAEADGIVDASERQRLPDALAAGFGLSPEVARRLVEAARRRDHEAMDFHGFASKLRRDLDLDGRRRIIGMMYDIAFADGVLHEFEGDLVARVAEVLEIPEADVADLRARAEAGKDGS